MMLQVKIDEVVKVLASASQRSFQEHVEALVQEKYGLWVILQGTRKHFGAESDEVESFLDLCISRRWIKAREELTDPLDSPKWQWNP